jgi:hypothetical protein
VIPAARMWTNPPLAGSTARYESLLDSAQFTYPLARIISYTAELSAAHRTPALKSFVARWAPVLLKDLYGRWVASLSP